MFLTSATPSIAFGGSAPEATDLSRCTSPVGDDPLRTPLRIYPAAHYTMGGLWVDYDLMTTIPGLFAAGEANFSDHGANRLGASALMQTLADGYFIVPPSVGNYLATARLSPVSEATGEVRETVASAGARIGALLAAAARGRQRRSTASSASSCGTTAASPGTRRT